MVDSFLKKIYNLTLLILLIQNNAQQHQILELKKVHQAGGRSTFTWMKQPGDMYTNMLGAALMTFGMAQVAVGYYRLATGKGKLD